MKYQCELIMLRLVKKNYNCNLKGLVHTLKAFPESALATVIGVI